MSDLRPVEPSERLHAIDALRGFALCGILLVNITQMGGPLAMERPMAAPALSDADWQLWIVAQLFITGTMRGLFSLLFGVGLLIFVGDDESADRSRLYLRRLMFLLLFGIVDCTLLLWPGDILVIYALSGFVVLMLSPLKPAWLLAAAGGILLLVSLWSGWEARSIPPLATVYSPHMLIRESTARLGDYGATLNYMSHVSWAWTVNALTYRWVGDTAALMLVGMALYRMGIFRGGVEPRTILWMAGIGYGLGLSLRLAHVVIVWRHAGGPTFLSALIDQPGRVAMTLGHVAAFQMLWSREVAPVLKQQLARMGRMALTLYLGQSLLAALVFSGFGLGQWNHLSWRQLWLVAMTMLAAEGLFAALWFKAFRFGPVEWLWRWGTYGRRPALLRASE